MVSTLKGALMSAMINKLSKQKKSESKLKPTRLRFQGLLALFVVFVLLLGGCKNEIPAEPALGAEAPDAGKATSPSVVAIEALSVKALEDNFFIGNTIALDISAKQAVDDSIIDDAVSLVACTVDANTIISIANDCNVTALSAGTISVHITLLRDELISTSLNITVLEVTEVLPLQLLAALNVGDAAQLSVNAKTSDDNIVENFNDIICTVAGTAITVTEACEITAIEAGDAVLTVSTKNTPTITGTITITVKAKGSNTNEVTANEIKSLTVQPLSGDFFVGESIALAISAIKTQGGTVDNATNLVKCASTANSVISVANDCNLTALSAGNSTISISLLQDATVFTSVDITVVAVTEVLPQPLLAALNVGGAAQLSVNAKTSAGDIVESFSDIICTAAGAVITVTEACEITAIEAGDALLTVSTKNTPTIITGTITITVKAKSSNTNPVTANEIKSLTVQAVSGDFFVGDSIALAISAIKTQGGTVDNATNLVKCASTANSVISVANDCKLTALSAGNSTISISLLQDATVFTSVDITVVAPTEVLPQALLSAIYIGDTVPLRINVKKTDNKIAEDFTNVICVASNQVVTVNGDCGVVAAEVGETVLTVFVKNDQTVFATVNIKVLAASTAIEQVSFAISDTEIVFQHQFKTDVFASYKIKMIADVEPNLMLPDYINVEVITSLNSSYCINSLASGKQTVACGVDTTGTDGVIDVYIDATAGNLSGILELTFDQDILENDDQGARLPSTLNDYTFLQVGASFDGHVSSNSSNMAATKSRYYTDVSNGLMSNAQGYRVTVKFQPDANDDYHFDANNVRVGWSFDASKAVPKSQSAKEDCVVSVAAADTVECNISGDKNDLFVTVSGNGDDASFGSNDSIPTPATADGELSYSVLIENK